MDHFSRHGGRRALEEEFASDLAFAMFDRIERSGLDSFVCAIAHDIDDGVTVRPILPAQGRAVPPGSAGCTGTG